MQWAESAAGVSAGTYDFTYNTTLVATFNASFVTLAGGTAAGALATLMGGMDSEVRESTKSILLESANFDATAIRRTAMRLGLHSEASHRFERGVDADGTLAALDRAGAMLAELAGATPVPGVVDCLMSSGAS